MAYDNETVLNSINLYVNDKEFLTLLAPADAANHHAKNYWWFSPTSGDVLFGGVRINDVPS